MCLLGLTAVACSVVLLFCCGYCMCVCVFFLGGYVCFGVGCCDLCCFAFVSLCCLFCDVWCWLLCLICCFVFVVVCFCVLWCLLFCLVVVVFPSLCVLVVCFWC